MLGISKFVLRNPKYLHPFTRHSLSPSPSPRYLCLLLCAAPRPAAILVVRPRQVVGPVGKERPSTDDLILYLLRPEQPLPATDGARRGGEVRDFSVAVSGDSGNHCRQRRYGSLSIFRALAVYVLGFGYFEECI